MVDVGDRLVVLLPGPPRELRPMMDALVARTLAARAGQERLFRTTLFTVGRGGVARRGAGAADLFAVAAGRTADRDDDSRRAGSDRTALRHPIGRRRSAGRALAAARDEILAALGPDVFSTDGRSMEEIVGQLLLDRQLTISAAESCTGGLLMSRLTDIPGSSAYVARRSRPTATRSKWNWPACRRR